MKQARGRRAYGGGRTIRQGEALESEEVAQARKQRIAEALSRYKQTSGTIVDASVEAAAQVSPELGRPESMRWIQFATSTPSVRIFCAPAAGCNGANEREDRAWHHTQPSILIVH